MTQKNSSRGRSGEAGFTLVELMVGMLLSGVLAAFVFAAYGKSASALRSQSRVADAQQALRSGYDKLVKDVRMAGLYSHEIHFPGPAPMSSVTYPPFIFIDGDSGDADPAEKHEADVLGIWFSDPTATTMVNPLSNAVVAAVKSTDGFKAGDVVIAVRTKGSSTNMGKSCALEISSVDAGLKTLAFKQTLPFGGLGNTHCLDPMGAVWPDDTQIAKLTWHTYRIDPTTTAGTLQVSSKGTGGPWTDLGTGFVDLQVAGRVFQKDDDKDEDGDGDDERDWFSDSKLSDQLEAGNRLTHARISVVTRSAVDEAPPVPHTPSVKNASMDKKNNDHSNHDPVSLPVTDNKSRYHGKAVYRVASSLVALRNFTPNVAN